MNISLLNVVVKIQKHTISIDSIGNHICSWMAFYKAYATVSAEGGSTKDSPFAVIDDSDISFSIRWCDKAKNINNTQYRILFNDKIYTITSVDHMNFKKKIIKLKCKKVRNE